MKIASTASFIPDLNWIVDKKSLSFPAPLVQIRLSPPIPALAERRFDKRHCVKSYEFQAHSASERFPSIPETPEGRLTQNYLPRNKIPRNDAPFQACPPSYRRNYDPTIQTLLWHNNFNSKVSRQNHLGHQARRTGHPSAPNAEIQPEMKRVSSILLISLASRPEIA
jgi:hypothetical protein